MTADTCLAAWHSDAAAASARASRAWQCCRADAFKPRARAEPRRISSPRCATGSSGSKLAAVAARGPIGHLADSGVARGDAAHQLLAQRSKGSLGAGGREALSRSHTKDWQLFPCSRRRRCHFIQRAILSNRWGPEVSLVVTGPNSTRGARGFKRDTAR